MSKESIIQDMKEELDYRAIFGRYISSNKGYLLAMYALNAPSITSLINKFQRRI